MNDQNSENYGREHTEAMEQSFAAAVKAAEAVWKSDEAWDHVEELGTALSRHDDVGALYLKSLKLQHPRERREYLALRTVAYHNEWFGGDMETMHSALTSVLETTPEAQWAFEQLTDLLITAASWDRLFAVYDRAIATQQSEEDRDRLLEEAANVAKDIAGLPDRAIDYLVRLHSADPETPVGCSFSRG